MTRAYVGLGSNLGDSLRTLRRARHAMHSLPQTQVVGNSHIYRSAAIGPGNQADYLNAVIALETENSASILLRALFSLEDGAGRERHERWEARTLDLDLLLYGEDQYELPDLSVPHPRLFERNFVLQPLSDLCADDFRFPDGSTLGDRLEACPANPIERTSLKWHESDSGSPL